MIFTEKFHFKSKNSMIFTDDFLKTIGFKREETKEPYGKAVDIRTNGMTQIFWNTEGHSCTYFGEKLEQNISFAIKKDGGTRYAFNGYVFSQEDVVKLLNLTW